MKKTYLWIAAAVLILSLIVGLQTLSIAPLYQQKSAEVSGFDVRYESAFTPLYRITNNCNWQVTDSSNGGVNVNTEAGSECEKGYFPRITIKPQIDLADYKTVVIRRDASMASICEGRYGSMSSTINGQTKEFATSASYNTIQQTQRLGDIYIQNDGLRIKVESTEGIILLDNKPDTYLELTQFAGCTFMRGQSLQSLSITAIEATPHTATETPAGATETPQDAQIVPRLTTVTLGWFEQLWLWIRATLNI